MMNQPVFLHLWEKILAIIVLSVSLATSLVGAGYQWRGVAETRTVVDDLKAKGSAQAQITAKDVEWLKLQNQEILNEVREIRKRLDQHMEVPVPRR